MTDTYFKLSDGDLIQDWSDPNLITTNDDWSGVPSIVGFRGDGLTGSTGTDPQTITGTSAVIDVNANQLNPNTNTTGGVTEFAIADPVVALQGSGTARAPYLAIYLDTTGTQNVTLDFNARDIDGSGDNAAQQIAVQYRIGSSGTWINLPAGYIADASTGGSATQVTPVHITLPADAANQPQVEIRIMTADAVGSDEWIGIDDIHVHADPLSGTFPGSLSIADASIAEGDAGTTLLTFDVTRSGGSDGAVSASWTLSNGTADGADIAGPLSGTVDFADGQTSATITIAINGDTDIEASEAFQILLAGATGGATIVDGSATGTIVNDDYPPVQNVFINEINYDPDGTDTGEFIEVAGLAGIDLTGWTIALYNGNGGGVYGTLSLGGTLGDQSNGFGFASITTPSNGIQNGPPDGMALVDPYGRVVQFISYEGTMTATSGPAAGMTSTDIGVFQAQAPIGTSLQLVGTGSSAADFQWGYNIDSTSGGLNNGQTFLSGTDEGQIRIDSAQVVEGNDGTSELVFVLHRAGGFATAAEVDYTLTLGSSDAADLAAGTLLTGTVTFAEGEFTQTIRVLVNGDTDGERNETLFITLGDVTGNAVVTGGQAVGTILNDDPISLTIMEIQGAGHVSEFVGQPVITGGIVTAIAGNGFYVQDASGDGDSRTSDAIFVFTGSAPTVLVGDEVGITGTVSEFGGGANLSVTQIVSPTISVLSQGNVLPEAVLIGSGGILPPTEAIDSDGLTIFNPETDGIDFWESLEGMRVTVDSPIVVSNSNNFGETNIVASGGDGATGVNDRGGITISAGDYNPEIIQLDDTLIGGPGYVADHTVGDRLDSVTGIINYSFGHYEVLATDVVTTTVDVTLTDEVTSLSGDANYLTLATYNVENLDSSDMKFDLLGHDIVYNLNAPDIIALQEIQDADGAGSGSDLSGYVTAQGLIDAIYAESGILYAYVEIAPSASGTTGGEPGGNIRNGYLYRVDRIDYVEGSAELIEDPAFEGSRRPLVTTWEFNGGFITTIDVHFTSRLGSESLWGSSQPPANGGEDSREAQAAAVGAWVNDHLADDPSLNLALLGDWNGFYFEDAQILLTNGGVFTNLAEVLLPEEERYSYIFDGNSQLIDNILVTEGLLSGAGYDAVHINAQFGPDGRPTDHDPQISRLLVGAGPSDLIVDGLSVDENSAAGTVVGTASATDSSDDTLTYALGADADGRFAIDGTTGVITTTGSLDHEQQPSYDIVVQATDSAGRTIETVVTVIVADLNERPTAVADSVAVDEDATTGNLWHQLLSNDSDPDVGDTLLIASVDTGATQGSVIFDAASETLRYVADADAFDYLATGQTATDSFSYTVIDADGLTHTATVTVTVTAIADGITLTFGNGNDSIEATAGEDVLSGGNGNDSLYGLDGHDRLDGGSGNDQLFGGVGNDLLVGGKGNDWLTGGVGHDDFIFGAKSGNDVVTDFDTANDRIVLRDGQSIVATSTADVDGDGHMDLVLTLASGSVTLLGTSTLDDVDVVSAFSTSRGGNEGPIVAAFGIGSFAAQATFGQFGHGNDSQPYHHIDYLI